MTTPRPAPLLLLSLLLLLAACDYSGSNDPPPSISGTWTGEITSQGVVFTFELIFNESNTFVSGSGTVTSPQETAGFSLDGSYLHPALSLRLIFPDRPPGSFNATVADDRKGIQGAISGPGFSGIIDLTKR